MKKRIDWIDSLKGFAIILVVIGHVADGYISSNIFPENNNFLYYIYNIIYSFHMALFFMISGILFKYAYIKDDQLKKEKVIRQLYNLIYIYFAFSIFQWFFKFFIGNNVNNAVTLKDLFLLPLKPMTPYWYIYDLIIFYIICLLFYKFNIQYKKRIKYVLYIFGIILYLVSNIINLPFLLDLHNKIKYFFMFFLGVRYIDIIKRIPVKYKNMSIFLTSILSCLLFIVIIICSKNKINIFRTNYLNLVIGSMVSFIIVTIFYKENIDNVFLKIIGKYSMEIYLIHCYFTFFNRIMLKKIMVNNFYFNFFINVILSTMMSIFVSIILKKFKLHSVIFSPFKTHERHLVICQDKFKK